MKDVVEPLLWHKITSHSVHDFAEHITRGYIHNFNIWESNNVGKLLTPSFFVNFWCVISVLTWIKMNPSLLSINKTLSPNMIRPIKHIPWLMAKCNAKGSETISPLTTPAITTVHECDNVVVSWEAHFSLATRAMVKLYSSSLSFYLISIRDSCSIFSIDSIWFGATIWAVRFISPFEKLCLIPFQKCFQLRNLFSYLYDFFRDNR